VEVFQTFNRDGNGFLKANELYFALKVLGFSLKQDFIDSVSQESDEKFYF
jgi:Ca2+-binding EF-hand superfamily protein